MSILRIFKKIPLPVKILLIVLLALFVRYMVEELFLLQFPLISKRTVAEMQNKLDYSDFDRFSELPGADSWENGRYLRILFYPDDVKRNSEILQGSEWAYIYLKTDEYVEEKRNNSPYPADIYWLFTEQEFPKLYFNYCTRIPCNGVWLEVYADIPVAHYFSVRDRLNEILSSLVS